MRSRAMGSVLCACLLAGSAVHAAETAAKPDTTGAFATSAGIDEFLREPVFVPPHKLWQGRGGWGGVLSTQNGTVVVFRSPGGGEVRRSRDGGRTWDEPIVIDPTGDRAAANGGNTLVD